MIQISKPTQAQILKGVELVVVTFVASFVAIWAGQPDPFTKAAVIAGVTGGAAAVYALAKSFLTDL